MTFRKTAVGFEFERPKNASLECISPPQEYHGAMTLEHEEQDSVWWCDKRKMKQKNLEVVANLLNLDDWTPPETREQLIRKFMNTNEAPSPIFGVNSPKMEASESLSTEKMDVTISDPCINPALPQLEATQEVGFKPQPSKMNQKFDPIPKSPKEDLKHVVPYCENVKVVKLPLMEVEKYVKAVEDMNETTTGMKVYSNINFGNGEDFLVQRLEVGGKYQFNLFPEWGTITLHADDAGSSVTLQNNAPENLNNNDERKKQDEAKILERINKRRMKRKETAMMRRLAKIKSVVEEVNKTIACGMATEQELAFKRTLEANEAFMPEVIENNCGEPKYPCLQDATISSVKGCSLRYSCEYCKRGFQQRYKWVNHIKIHIGQLLHKCSCVRCEGVPYRDYRTMRKLHNSAYK